MRFHHFYFGIALLSVALMTSGCHVETAIEFENHAGKTVHVFTGTQNSIETPVLPGKSEVLGHTIGPIVIKCENGQIWSYRNVEVPTIASESPQYRVYFKRYFVTPVLRIRLRVDPDGKIYAIPASRNMRKNFAIMQPLGFPLIPEIKNAELGSDLLAPRGD